MKSTLKLSLALVLLGGSVNASAWWGGDGWDWNPWPVWTPMYWMEEMIDNNDWYDGYGPGYGGYGSPYGYGPGYGNPYGYGPGYGGYGSPYYGYGTSPYGAYGNSYVNPWR